MIKIIKLYIEGHSYEHDLFELIRTFFKGKEISFIDRLEVDTKKGYLIVSKLVQYKESKTSITSLYYDNNLIEEIIEDIENIKISAYHKKQIEKLAIKKGVYNCLSKSLDIYLPWGILTGIRPVKVVHNLLDLNFSNGEVLKILENEYKFLNSKASLILDIALFQRKHIYPTDENKFSLYINIPFCPSKCSYCSFSSFEISKNKKIVEEYIDTLIFEIKASKDIFKGKKLNTILGNCETTLLK